MAIIVEYICVLVFLVTEGYFCSLCHTYRLILSLSIAPSADTQQCQVDTIPSQTTMLVPGFQEPPAAGSLSELISIHE